jgi:hypothetical protein
MMEKQEIKKVYYKVIKEVFIVIVGVQIILNFLLHLVIKLVKSGTLKLVNV